MTKGRRYVGSGAFHASTRRGRASPSASQQPEAFLKAIAAGSITISDLTQALGANPEEVREQLRVLEALGLVSRRALEPAMFELSRTGQRALDVSFLAVA